jgi:hypothetical protein
MLAISRRFVSLSLGFGNSFFPRGEALHFLAFGYVLSSFNIELQVKEE